MKAPQILGIVAVVIVLVALAFYESRRSGPPETETFAPAQSADESVPADDTPIEPPAEIAAAPAEEPAVAEGSEVAEASAPETETVVEAEMDSVPSAEAEPGEPALAEVEPEPEAPPAAEPDVAVAEPEPEPEPAPTPEPEVAMAEPAPEPEGPALDRQTPAVDPSEAEAEAAPADTPSETEVAVVDEEAVDAEPATPAPAEPPGAEADDDVAVAVAEPEPTPSEPVQDAETDEAAAVEEPTAIVETGEAADDMATTEAEAPATEAVPQDEVEIAVVEPEGEPPADEEGAVIEEESVLVEPEVVPTFDVVRIEPTGDTVVAGLAAPGSTVEIMDGPTVVAAAQANERGEWALALEEPLPPGTHDLAIRTTSEDRSVVTLSDQRVAVSVPEAAAEEPLVVLDAPDTASRILQVPEAEAPEPEVAVVEEAPPTAPEAPAAEPEPDVARLPAEPAGAEEPAEAVAPAMDAETAAEERAPAEPEAVADAAPAPEAVAPEEPMEAPEIGVAAVEADTAGGLFVAGTAETEETVRVYLDDEFIGEAEPSQSGTWLVEVRRELPEGTYRVRADQVEEGTGTVIARAEVPFEREIAVAILKPTATTEDQTGTEVAAAVAGPETVIIKRGDNLWRIARRIYGRGIRYSTIYQANRDQIRDPHWIYPGQVFVLPEGNVSWDN